MKVFLSKSESYRNSSIDNEESLEDISAMEFAPYENVDFEDIDFYPATDDESE